MAKEVDPLTGTRSVLEEVYKERERQARKFGLQDHPRELWLSVLVEEVGEVAKEALNVTFGDESPENYRTELLQVAAVAVAMIEAEDRRRNVNPLSR